METGIRQVNRMATMTKEEFLTVRWNNLLTLGLGLPALLFILYAFSTSLWMEPAGMIGLSIIGVVYWLIIEGHTAMRFAWLRKDTTNEGAVKQASTQPISLIRKAYNAAFWIFLLPFFTVIEYSTGFIVFTIIILIRLCANLYANNIIQLTPAQYDQFPFRIP